MLRSALVIGDPSKGHCADNLVFWHPPQCWYADSYTCPSVYHPLVALHNCSDVWLEPLTCLTLLHGPTNLHQFTPLIHFVLPCCWPFHVVNGNYVPSAADLSGPLCGTLPRSINGHFSPTQTSLACLITCVSHADLVSSSPPPPPPRSMFRSLSEPPTCSDTKPESHTKQQNPAETPSWPNFITMDMTCAWGTNAVCVPTWHLVTMIKTWHHTYL
jgi:hypothetical protein